jgi:hypothetical protein
MGWMHAPHCQGQEGDIMSLISGAACLATVATTVLAPIVPPRRHRHRRCGAQPDAAYLYDKRRARPLPGINPLHLSAVSPASGSLGPNEPTHPGQPWEGRPGRCTVVALSGHAGCRSSRGSHSRDGPSVWRWILVVVRWHTMNVSLCRTGTRVRRWRDASSRRGPVPRAWQCRGPA